MKVAGVAIVLSNHLHTLKAKLKRPKLQNTFSVNTMVEDMSVGKINFFR